MVLVGDRRHRPLHHFHLIEVFHSKSSAKAKEYLSKTSNRLSSYLIVAARIEKPMVQIPSTSSRVTYGEF